MSSRTSESPTSPPAPLPPEGGEGGAESNRLSLSDAPLIRDLKPKSGLSQVPCLQSRTASRIAHGMTPLQTSLLVLAAEVMTNAGKIMGSVRMVFRALKSFAVGVVGLALFSSPVMAQEKPADDGNLPETGETGASTEEQAEQDARDEEWLREHERMVREKNYERWVHWLGEADYDFLDRMGAERISHLIQAFRETSDRERIEEIERDFGDERGYCGFLREQTEEAREWLAHLDQLTAERGSREAAARDDAYETLKELIAKYDEHLEADCD